MKFFCYLYTIFIFIPLTVIFYAIYFVKYLFFKKIRDRVNNNYKYFKSIENFSNACFNSS